MMPADDSVSYTNNDIMNLLKSVDANVKANKVKLNALEDKHNELVSVVNIHDNRIGVLEKKYNQLISMEKQRVHDVKRLKIDAMYREMHSKRGNVHVFGLEERSAWETKVESADIVSAFFKDALQISEDIGISDAHRLPLSANGTGPRPLILKLQKLLDKKLIADNLKNLKSFNKDKPVGSRVFIELDHLPQKWRDDKRLLKDKAKEARQAGLKPRFKPNRESGDYCLHVGKHVFCPKPILSGKPDDNDAVLSNLVSAEING